MSKRTKTKPPFRRNHRKQQEVTFKLPEIILEALPKTKQQRNTVNDEIKIVTDSEMSDSRTGLLSPNEARSPSLPALPPRGWRVGSGESGSEDGGYDTDLDMTELTEHVLVPAPPRYDKSSREVYLEHCGQRGILPSSRFLRECQTDCVNLAHYGLGNSGTFAVAKALERNLTVSILNLYDNSIEYQGTEYLSRMLSMNCFITHLNLSGNKIGRRGIVAIGNMLMENASLTFLNLANCVVSGRDMEVFCHALGRNPHLKTFIFHSNDLSEDGSTLMANALITNSTLETLDLGWNNIRTLAISEIARGIKSNHAIRELDLSWNGFQDQGARALHGCLHSNSTLKVLDITNCGIFVKGAEAIAAGLRVNKSLEILKIGRNPFQSAGVPLLLEAVRMNGRSRLREMVLDGIVFLEDGDAELAKLLEDRPSFNCCWASSIRGGHVSKGHRKPHDLDIFLKFVRNMGFRLVDLFMILAKDNDSLEVTKEEFVIGLKKLNAPLKDDQLRVIFDSLDGDNNGTLDFQEFYVMRSHTLKKFVRKMIHQANAMHENDHIKKLMH